MNDDDELLARLGDAMNTPVPDPSEERLAGVRDAAQRAQDARRRGISDAPRAVSSRRAVVIAAAAAAIGAIGGAVVADVADDDEPTTSEPPTEALQFSREAALPEGVTLSGRTINHTWGVELLLDTDGFPIGEPYQIVYIDNADVEIEAGGFIGSEIAIHCRCNAALLRADIDAIEIRDARQQVVSRAAFA